MQVLKGALRGGACPRPPSRGSAGSGIAPFAAPRPPCGSQSPPDRAGPGGRARRRPRPRRGARGGISAGPAAPRQGRAAVRPPPPLCRPLRINEQAFHERYALALETSDMESGRSDVSETVNEFVRRPGSGRRKTHVPWRSPWDASESPFGPGQGGRGGGAGGAGRGINRRPGEPAGIAGGRAGRAPPPRALPAQPPPPPTPPWASIS